MDNEFMDENPMAKSYYRLRTIDFDRSEQNSEVVALTRASEGFEVTTAFPNPTNEVINVQFHSPTNSDVQIRLTDFTGKIVQSYEIDAQDGINNLEVNMSDLASGTYFLSLSNNAELIVERLIKQ